MGIDIRRADYYQTRVKDRPGEGYKLLTWIAAQDVNLLAFAAVPLGPDRAQLTLFPEHVEHLAGVAEKGGLVLEGPFPAILVQGDDKLGAFAEVHARLFDANVNVYASSGVTDGRGAFGYVLYVQPGEVERAVTALSGLMR
jgi:hypothetical protein